MNLQQGFQRIHSIPSSPGSPSFSSSSKSFRQLLSLHRMPADLQRTRRCLPADFHPGRRYTSPSPCKFLIASKRSWVGWIQRGQRSLFSAEWLFQFPSWTATYLQSITSQFLFRLSVLLVPLTHKGGIIDPDSAGHSVTSGYVSAKPEEPNRKCLTHIKKHRAMWGFSLAWNRLYVERLGLAVWTGAQHLEVERAARHRHPHGDGHNVEVPHLEDWTRNWRSCFRDGDTVHSVIPCTGGCLCICPTSPRRRWRSQSASPEAPECQRAASRRTLRPSRWPAAGSSSLPKKHRNGWGLCSWFC